jgi:hypothetical protein
VTLAVLAAAVLHATWNAFAARLPDKLAGLGAIGLAQLALCPLALALVPAPAAPSRPYVLVSSTMHVGYDLLLLNGYRVGELSRPMEPICRARWTRLTSVSSVGASSRLPSQAMTWRS